ncbi:MAG: phosphoglucosamine mutase, partial [Planctomycetes bacterium]|nr:phosphoglucosamine mutase [Planctomycetota bacterium]
MALIVDLLVRSGKTISELVAEIPQYGIHKEKVAISRADLSITIQQLLASDVVAGSEVDSRDGWKFVWPDRWLHVRASGTEPASRIITEAPQLEQASQLAADARAVLGVELITGH